MRFCLSTSIFLTEFTFRWIVCFLYTHLNFSFLQQHFNCFSSFSILHLHLANILSLRAKRSPISWPTNSSILSANSPSSSFSRTSKVASSSDVHASIHSPSTLSKLLRPTSFSTKSLSNLIKVSILARRKSFLSFMVGSWKATINFCRVVDQRWI